MGRNRTPTAILETRGSFLGSNSARRRSSKSEPAIDAPLGTPPKHLSDSEKKIWREIAKQLAPGVGKKSDRTAFELLVRLTNQMRSGYATMTSAERTCLLSVCSHFGLSPSSRSKISVQAPKQSKLADFLAKRPKAMPPPEIVQ